MFAIEVEFLTGRYTATRVNDRNQPEWPPHPARLFSAMVARWADSEAPEERERAALEWLEALGPPHLSCGEADGRSVVTHYVPVNDTSVVRSQDSLYAKLVDADEALRRAQAEAGGTAARELAKITGQLARLRTQVATSTVKAGARADESDAALAAAQALLPDRRGRQGRTYPTVLPIDERMWLVWPDIEADPAQADALDGLLARVSRLGHSSSLVACRVTDDPGPVTWVPDGNGDEPLRVMAPGLLARLVAEFERHQGSEPRTLPAAAATYRRVTEGRRAPATVPLLGGEWFVLARRSGATLPVTAALGLAEAVRGALLRHSGTPSPAFLSGHPEGAPGERTPPVERPHLAIVPLPYVASEYADGSLLGVALVLPRAATAEERRTLLRALGGWRDEEKLFPVRLGPAGLVRLELVDDALESRTTLLRRTWCRPWRRWVSVTPVALDRFPGNLRDRDPDRRAKAEGEAVKVIVKACEYAGLPRPQVEIELDAPLLGVPPLRSFPAYRRAEGRVTRPSVHVRLTFEEAVAGPVLIGAGRYLGYGLCRPVQEQGDEDAA